MLGARTVYISNTTTKSLNLSCGIENLNLCATLGLNVIDLSRELNIKQLNIMTRDQPPYINFTGLIVLPVVLSNLGRLELTRCIRINVIDLSGAANIQELVLDEMANLNTLLLPKEPSKLSKVKIWSANSLVYIDLSGAVNIQELVLDEMANLNTLLLPEEPSKLSKVKITYANSLEYIDLSGSVNIQVLVLKYMANLNTLLLAKEPSKLSTRY